MRMTGVLTVTGVLLLTGCLGFWVHTPEEIEDISSKQETMRNDLVMLREAVGTNENLLRGLQAQSGTRTLDLVERLSALADELDLALARLGNTGVVNSRGDTTASPGAQVIFDEAYDQFQRGGFEIAAEGFRELYTKYPSSPLADDAFYYMAICWEETGSPHRAVEDLVALSYLYPDSEWAPGALFRAADIYGSHGASSDRDRLFDLLLERYPESDEAALVRELRG